MTSAGVPLAEKLISTLRERGETVATAESLTAGLVCVTLTEVPGASAVVRGGLIVYATDLKQRLAGVDGSLLARHGAVHPEVAAQMAAGARDKCGATWGIGLTGVAGPDPQDGVAPGTVYLAVASAQRHTGRKLIVSGARQQVRQSAAVFALELLIETLGAD